VAHGLECYRPPDVFDTDLERIPASITAQARKGWKFLNGAFCSLS